MVLTTKFTNSVDPGDPNAGGNGRKHMIRAVDDSLRRLGTDYVDLFLLHTWDRITPVEEVLRTFDDLTRAGKIRYAGLSDVPAWYAARAQTLAEAHAMTPMVNLQLPYSLVERTIETEHVPVGQQLGLGVTAWSPLGGGFLTGKYRRDDASRRGRRRSAHRRWRAGADVDRSALGAVEDAGSCGGQARRDDGPGRGQLGRDPARDRFGHRRREQPRAAARPAWQLSTSSCRTSSGPHSTRPAPYLRESVYRMFTPEYQGWLVNAGAKVGDKPTGYRPPVLNWS